MDKLLAIMERVPESEWTAGVLFLILDTLLIVILLPIVLGVLRARQWRPARRHLAKTIYEEIAAIMMIARSLRQGFEQALGKNPETNPNIHEFIPLDVGTLLKEDDIGKKIRETNRRILEIHLRSHERITSIAGAYSAAMSPPLAESVAVFQDALSSFTDACHITMWSLVGEYSDEFAELDWEPLTKTLFRIERSLRHETGQKPDSVHYHSYAGLKDEFRSNLQGMIELAKELQLQISQREPDMASLKDDPITDSALPSRLRLSHLKRKN